MSFRLEVRTTLEQEWGRNWFGQGQFTRLLSARAWTARRRMKIAPLPSLDKEGQAAARGCCRGGSKAARVSKSKRWG